MYSFSAPGDERELRRLQKIMADPNELPIDVLVMKKEIVERIKAGEQPLDVLDSMQLSQNFYEFMEDDFDVVKAAIVEDPYFETNCIITSSRLFELYDINPSFIFNDRSKKYINRCCRKEILLKLLDLEPCTYGWMSKEYLDTDMHLYAIQLHPDNYYYAPIDIRLDKRFCMLVMNYHMVVDYERYKDYKAQYIEDAIGVLYDTELLWNSMPKDCERFDILACSRRPIRTTKADIFFIFLE